MQCPCPISIKDPRAKNASVRVTVPCMKCPICLQNKRVEWSIRLQEELRVSNNAWFLTLTYEDEKIPIHKESGLQTLRYKDVQDFNKRLRYEIQKAYGKKGYKKMRYYLVGEYGTKTKRPHYHGIYFNVPYEIMEKFTDIWQQGYTYTGICKPAAIHYVCKYMINKEEIDSELIEKPKALMSLKPAIGHTYVKRNDAWHIHNKAMYMVVNDQIVRMPRYYKDKIFNEDEKNEIAKTCQEQGDKEYLKQIYKAQVGNYNYDSNRIDKIENQFRIIKKQSKSN